MANIILAVFFLLFLIAVYAFGYTYAGVQAKKERSFRTAFGRSFWLLAIMTVLFSIPILGAYGMSVNAFPDAFDFVQHTTWRNIEMLSTTFFGHFGMLGLPFFAGVWRRYTKLETVVAP